MTRTLTWVVVGGIVSLLVVGAVDALRPSGTPTSASKTTAAPKRPAGDQISLPVETESVPPPRCTAQQLALTIENLGGGPALALLHVWAEPCRTPRLPIEVALLDRAGHSVEATVGIQPAFPPTTLSSNVALSAPFTFVYLCGEPKPVFAVADAGPYSARGRLPRSYGACLEDLGP
jgi:hypothetical protein